MERALTMPPEEAGPVAVAGPAGTVVYWPDAGGGADGHVQASHRDIVRRLAALRGWAADGGGNGGVRRGGPVYAVPADTLVGVEEAAARGVRSQEDLFGGVVPYAFVATKAISHPLVGPDAAAPAGWSVALGPRLEGVVLPGFSAFSRADARRAADRLLALGPVRVKAVCEMGGHGQAVAADRTAFDRVLDAHDPGVLARDGLVLETNLTDVTTHSVGQVRVAGLVASYVGTQRLTPDRDGAPVYGGSELTVVRGGFDAMLQLPLSDAARHAVALARAYDAAAAAAFPGFFASRRNYDVARGRDAGGRWRAGVLEQSWRIGGASPAEIAALEVFHADPARTVVHAACVELHGPDAAVPAGAMVAVRGEDPRAGFITKYTVVEPDGPRRMP